MSIVDENELHKWAYSISSVSRLSFELQHQSRCTSTWVGYGLAASVKLEVHSLSHFEIRSEKKNLIRKTAGCVYRDVYL
ncbi:hypothetical protein GE21DRAFT_1201651 [Neurospora crassa]|nr:hypothetical protein GE21DRAFT_1201651 [Neurospora crassa]